MISKQEDAVPEIRKTVARNLDETDKVTAQLNEFINIPGLEKCGAHVVLTAGGRVWSSLEL